MSDILWNSTPPKSFRDLLDRLELAAICGVDWLPLVNRSDELLNAISRIANKKTKVDMEEMK